MRVAWRIDDAGGCVQFGHRADSVERVEEPQGELRRELGGDGARFGVNSKVRGAPGNLAQRDAGQRLTGGKVSVSSSQATSAPVVVSTMAPEESTMAVSSVPSAWYSVR